MRQIQNRGELTELIRYHNLKTGLELGVFDGRFSEVLLAGSSLNKLYSVDAWDLRYFKPGRTAESVEEAYSKTKDRLGKFGERSEILRMESSEAAEQFPDGFFDFIYIDASHGYMEVLRDLVIWWPKLRLGGLFSGHDYFHRPEKKLDYWGVVQAVDAFVARHKLDLAVTKEKMPSWYLLKPIGHKWY